MTLPVLPKPAVFPSCLISLMALVLTACSTTIEPAIESVKPPPPIIFEPEPEPETPHLEPEVKGYTPPHMSEQNITRIGLLLPFTAQSKAARAEAVRILQAAQLALFEKADTNLVILPKDTAGTPQGARESTRAAISDGADLLIGPLFSSSVEAAGRIARHEQVPMLALSTDASFMGEGVYQLSFPPNEEVRRVTEYVAKQGATRFAFIGPATTYGQVAHQAYQRTITEMMGEDPEPVEVEIELPVPEELSEEDLLEYEPETELHMFEEGLVSSVYYHGGIEGMTEAAARLTSIGVEQLDPEEATQMSGANWIPSLASAFQVVLLPEGGDELRMLAPVLLYEDVDPLLVKFIGTGVWRNPDLRREPALSHGWFAGPDPTARERFETLYESSFGDEPSRLAGLGYDAASLASLLAKEDQFTIERLTDPNGFLGVDGLFRFRKNGTIERGLAIYTVRRGEFRVLDPAPERFDLNTDMIDIEPGEPS